MKRFVGKVDVFAPSLGDKDAIIPCSFDFDLKKKKILKQTNKQTNKTKHPPAPTSKKFWRTTKQVLFLALYMIMHYLLQYTALGCLL